MPNNIITYNADSELLVYDADPEWVEIRSDIKCSAGQFLTVQNHEMVCAYLPDNYIIIYEETPMWTLSNIVTVAIIAAIVYKLMPKVTLRNFFKAVLKLIVRPFQRKEIEIKREWDIAKKDR